MNTNNLIIQYAKANLEIDGVYYLSIPPGTKAYSQTTMKGVCGFVIPIRGKARFRVCNENYELEKGIILHAGSGMDLSKEVIGEENWEFILLHYKVLQEDIEKDSLFTSHYTIPILPDQHQEILKILDSILTMQKEFGTKHMLSTKILLYEFLSKLFSVPKSNASADQKERLDEMLDYIHEHLSQNLSVAQIAEHFSLSAKQFNYYFQKKTGIAPKKYLIETQIKRAKELLLESELSIIEIASRVGYEDALHFSRNFKHSTGISPSLFRQQFEKNPC